MVKNTKSEGKRKRKFNYAGAKLPEDPVEFARALKKFVSEDFINTYKSIKRILVKH